MSDFAETPIQTHAVAARASFWRRFAAFFIDGIILGIVQTILNLVFDSGLAAALSLAVSLGYFTYLEGGTGQTLGKRALGIRVVDQRGGGSIGYGRAAIRWIGRIVSTIPLLLGYFWMIWDRDKQTWHDKFASSVVVPA
jgi:uncharacterized RDD family membrane protein YckC